MASTGRMNRGNDPPCAECCEMEFDLTIRSYVGFMIVRNEKQFIAFRNQLAYDGLEEDGRPSELFPNIHGCEPLSSSNPQKPDEDECRPGVNSQMQHL